MRRGEGTCGESEWRVRASARRGRRNERPYERNDNAGRPAVRGFKTLQPLVENLQRAGSGASLNTLFHNSCYGVYIYIYVSFHGYDDPSSFFLSRFRERFSSLAWNYIALLEAKCLAFQGKDNWTWFRGIERKFDEEIGGNFSSRVDVFPLSSFSSLSSLDTFLYWIVILKINSMAGVSRDFYIYVTRV